MHFRTDAVRAAAKHLNSIAHEFPNRNFQPTVEALGYRITDCTYALKETHNEEVLLAFKNGYVPQNKQRHQGERVKYPFGKTNVGVATTTEEAPALLTSQITTMSRARVKAAQPSNPIVDFDTPRRSKSRMLHKEPKAFYLYNCHYSEEVDGEETDGIWPVLVLGWHDLRPGNAPIDRLGDTPLLANNSDPPPPRCYIYEGSNKKDRITGWATGYENGGRNYKKRKYPVMFFDDYESAGRKNSYAWMSCDDLERFPIERKEAPKTRGYKPRAFNIARAFIAEREGFGSWAERETARLEGRLGKYQSHRSTLF